MQKRVSKYSIHAEMTRIHCLLVIHTSRYAIVYSGSCSIIYFPHYAKELKRLKHYQKKHYIKRNTIRRNAILGDTLSEEILY